MSEAPARRSADIVWNFSARHELPARAQTRENGWQHEEVLAMLTALMTEVGKFRREVAALRSSPSRPLPPRSPRSPLRVGFRRAAFQRQQQRQEVQALRQTQGRQRGRLVCRMGRQEQCLHGVSKDGGKRGLQYFRRDFGRHYVAQQAD